MGFRSMLFHCRTLPLFGKKTSHEGSWEILGADWAVGLETCRGSLQPTCLWGSGTNWDWRPKLWVEIKGSFGCREPESSHSSYFSARLLCSCSTSCLLSLGWKQAPFISIPSRSRVIPAKGMWVGSAPEGYWHTAKKIQLVGEEKEKGDFVFS